MEIVIFCFYILMLVNKNKSSNNILQKKKNILSNLPCIFGFFRNNIKTSLKQDEFTHNKTLKTIYLKFNVFFIFTVLFFCLFFWSITQAPLVHIQVTQVNNCECKDELELWQNRGLSIKKITYLKGTPGLI